MTPSLVDFKQWNINAKNRKSLAKTIGNDAAKIELPPLYQSWKQKKQLVIKEMTKFANGNYACHILTDSQKSELQSMLDNILNTPADVPVSKQFTCSNLWFVWGGITVQQ